MLMRWALELTMKMIYKMKLLLLLLLLPFISSAQYVVKNNELGFIKSPGDTTWYGPAALEDMIKVIRTNFIEIDSTKLSINIPPNTIGIPSYYNVAANASTNQSTLIDIPGLVIPLLANSVYEFDVVMSVGVTAVATGVQYGVNYSVPGATVEAIITGPATTGAAKSKRINELTVPTEAFLVEANLQGGTRITGSIITGPNAGNLSIKHLKVTSGLSVIFANSYARVTRIFAIDVPAQIKEPKPVKPPKTIKKKNK